MSASVQGKCPACGWKGLFLGSGGYVTCSQYDCPDPGAPADLLADPHGWKPKVPAVSASEDEA